MSVATQGQIDALQEIADNVGGTLRGSYSGRGMFGSTCMAIKCDDATEVIEEAAAAGIRGARQDQLGRRQIVYWPGLEAPADFKEQT